MGFGGGYIPPSAHKKIEEVLPALEGWLLVTVLMVL